MKKANKKSGYLYQLNKNVANSGPGNVLLKELSRDKIKTPERFIVGSAGEGIKKRRFEI
jgi:hypothetical protein